MAEKEKSKTVSVTVAPGRTLQRGGQPHGPGSEIEVGADEAPSLIALGHVIDPGKIDEPVKKLLPPSGPSITTDGGAHVRLA